jgi:MULE transposase domain
MGVDELTATPHYTALAPPPEKAYPSVDAAIADVNTFAGPRGYAVVKGRVNKNKNFTRIKKVWIQCDRGGKVRSTIVDSEDVRRPGAGSKKVKCPFKATLKATADQDNAIVNGEAWQLSVEYSHHNHEPSIDRAAHPALRKMEKDLAFKAAVKAQKHAGMEANHTYASHYGENPEALITKRDIHNERANVRRQDLGGLAPIHALLRFVLSTNEVKKEFTSTFECENGVAGGPLKYLFVMHDKHIKLLRANSEVLIADATYKTNRFNMPLLNIVGMAPNNMSFFAASMFLPGEVDVDFEWAFQQLKEVYDVQKLPYPRVILTDADGAQARAIKKVFPNTIHLLCIWHVNKNIQKKIRPLFKKECTSNTQEEINIFMNERWNVFLKDWFHAISASTEKQWEEEWKAFQEKYDNQYPSIIIYIDIILIQPHKEQLVKAWVNRHMHWDNQATSRGEGLHNTLKIGLVSSLGDLKDVMDKYLLILRRQYREIMTNLTQDRQKASHRTNIPLFARVIEKVTTHALKLVLKNQERLRKLKEGEELPLCTGQFYSATGVPYAHTVQKRLANGEPLRPEDFDSHWFFTKPIDGTHPLPDAIDLAQNPRTVQAKGRPKGSYGKGKANSSTERDSSHWEVIEAQITGDGSQLRGIHRQPKKRERLSGAKQIPKASAVKRRGVETLDLTGGSPIEISSDVKDDEGEEEGEKDNIADNRFVRIEDMEAPRRPPPRKKFLKYIVDTSSDEETSLKRPRRSSYARRAPKKSL